MKPRTSLEAKLALKNTRRALLEARRQKKDAATIQFLEQRVTELRELKRRLRRSERDHDESWRFACTPQPRGTHWQTLRGWQADTQRALDRLVVPDEEWRRLGELDRLDRL